jgi:integrase
VPQLVNRLSARSVASLSKPGRHADGNGLYVVVDKSGAKRWVFMSWAGGRQVETGLGGIAAISLAMARERAQECRRLVANGKSPTEARRRQSPQQPTFGDIADEVIASLQDGWRNAKHGAQWQMTMRVYAAPIRSKPVANVSTDDVLKVLRPIWTEKAETASRVRGRIERVLDAAKAKGFRSGENPARWRGHLDHLLPRRRKLQRGHHPAMPWADVPGFVARLRNSDSVGARCLEFVVLTAARSGEVLHSKRDGQTCGALWTEIDFHSKLWTVPAVRMKAGREHRVPLSTRVMDILAEMQQLRTSPFIFPGPSGAPLSSMALEAILRRMELKPGATVHGFRSSFRDYVGEATEFPRDLAEAALAHFVGDAVERAYRRGDALERRRALMEAWAQHCGSALSNTEPT